MNVNVSVPADAAADVYYLKNYLENRLLGASPWALETIFDAVIKANVRRDPFCHEVDREAPEEAQPILGNEYAAWLVFGEAEAGMPWVQRAMEVAQWTFDQTPVMLAEFEQWRNEYAASYQRDRDVWWGERRERSREEFFRRRRENA